MCRNNEQCYVAGGFISMTGTRLAAMATAAITISPLKVKMDSTMPPSSAPAPMAALKIAT